MNPRLYIGNLSPSVTEDDLRLLFSRAGAVIEVQLMLDPATQQSRGFAFVTMATPELAAAALTELGAVKTVGQFFSSSDQYLSQSLLARTARSCNMDSALRSNHQAPAI